MYEDASHFNCLTPPGVKNTILLLYLCLIKYSSVNFSCSSCNAYMGRGVVGVQRKLGRPELWPCALTAGVCM